MAIRLLILSFILCLATDKKLPSRKYRASLDIVRFTLLYPLLSLKVPD